MPTKRKTTVSAVIPTFNRAALVGRAIDSVLAQTLPVDELIVVDDGSTDNTCAAVARYGPPVRYVRQENAGLAASRNTGAREARSEWVAFLDDDDEWLPGKIERQVEALAAHPDAVLCYGAGFRRTPETPETYVLPVPPNELRKSVLIGNPFTQCSVMVRKDFFHSTGGFNPRLRCVEDWEFAARLVATGREFVMVREPLVRIHQSAGGMSSDARSMLHTELSILDTLLAGARGPVRLVRRLRTVSRMYFRAAVSARARGDAYLHYLFRSLACWPSPVFEPKRYKALLLHLLRGGRLVNT